VLEQLILFTLGVVLGGAITWGVAYWYYKKASEDQEKLLAQFAEDLGARNTLRYFRHLLDTSEWQKEHIGNRECWIAQSNNTYQIERGERGDDFEESWTKVHPNPDSARYPVFLKIGDTVIKELTFVAVDEGRIFVPMPEVEANNEQPRYFWVEGSLEMQVCRIIGKYYVYKSVERVAKRSGIEIRSDA
jgi:hypothetical protein